MHQAKIRAFLLRLSHHQDVADDLAQETFITAFEKLGAYKGSGSFSAWLFRIAYNRFLMHYRAAKRREQVNQSYSNEQSLRVNFFDGISDEQLDLELALQKLKPEQAAAISLCHSFGYSHSEAAEILSLPIGTVKTNILRGKDHLRLLLEQPKKTQKTG